MIALLQAAVIIGTWQGTSTCVDRTHYPSCQDEQVVYTVRSHAGTRDTVTLRAEKIVNGAREMMSEDDFVRQRDGSWAATLRTRRFHLRILLRVSGDRMTGQLTDLDAQRKVRDMALRRSS